MPKTLPPKEKRFKPGQSGNPAGRPKIDPAIKRLAKLTQENVKEIGDVIVLGTRADLKTLLEDPNSNGLQAWFAACVVKGINKGDMYSLNELLNRLIGKVKEQVELTIPIPTIIRRPSGEEVILGAKMIEKKEENQ